MDPQRYLLIIVAYKHYYMCNIVKKSESLQNFVNVFLNMIQCSDGSYGADNAMQDGNFR